MHRDAGECACRIICTGTPENGGAIAPYSKGATVAEVPFHNSIIAISWFIKIDLK